jgi:hypothetical protein
MRRSHVLPAILLVASIATPISVAAQTPPAPATPPADDAAKKEEAKEHFLKGAALMREEQWEAAQVEFQASIALHPTRGARKNAASCLRQLGRFAEALEMYEAILRDHAAQMSPADLEEARRTIAELQGLTGFLAITSVAGATVIVDSRPRGQTPLPNVRVSQGTHVVRVLKEGYVPFETTVSVLGKQTVTVDADLQVLARSGRIQIIEETGAEAEVIIDGAPKGKVSAQPYEERIGPGAHWVVLKGPGILGTEPVPVNVQVDQTVVLRMRLVELAGEARIETDPVGSAIILDGVAVGQGSWEGRLRPGPHKLDVSSEGYFRSSRTFEVAAEGKTALKVLLDRDENSPFWTAGRVRRISVGVVGGGLFGLFGFGSDYERSCSNGADCYARSRPFGGIASARAGYEVAPGLAIEVELGYAYVRSSLSRKMTMFGEQNARVAVDVTDEWSLRGIVFGVGASYAFVRRPIIVTGAITGGAIIGATIRDRRGGTTPCLSRGGVPECSGVETSQPPSPRSMPAVTGSESKTIPWFTPEIRIAYPITEAFQIGIGLGAFVGITDARPRVAQTPDRSPQDLDERGLPVPPRTAPTPDQPARSIGFVPSSDRAPETAVGTFVLPRASLFVKLAF